MKSVVSTVVLFSLMFQFAAQFGTLLYFEANQKYIAKTQCENIAKPQMHCNGQCVLSKLLKKTAQDEENKKEFNSRTLDITIFILNSFEFKNPVIELKKEMPAYSSSFFVSIPRSIFHPPPVVA